jgi:hypothetical protein
MSATPLEDLLEEPGESVEIHEVPSVCSDGVFVESPPLDFYEWRARHKTDPSVKPLVGPGLPSPEDAEAAAAPAFGYRPKLQKFLRSRKPINAAMGGYGSGKSVGLIQKCYSAMRENAGLEHVLSGLTVETTRDTLMPTFIAFLDFMSVRYAVEKQRRRITLPRNGAFVQFLSSENWERWPGRNVAWFGLDELALAPSGAYKQAHMRTRIKAASLCQVAFSTTPEGFNFVYDEVGNVTEDDPLKDVTTIETSDNADALRPGYVEEIRRSYGDRLAEAYEKGRFIDVRTGRVYYAAIRERYAKPVTYAKDKALYLTFDFNVDPGVALMGHREGDTLRFFDEVHIEDSNTKRLCEEITQRYRGHAAPVYVYGDASGGQRKSSAERTDWQIVENLLRALGHSLDMRVRASNPSVIDRVNAVNVAFEKGCIEINSEQCPHLVVDLDQVGWKPGTHEILKPTISVNEMDKRKKALTHLSDALGYLVHWEMPVTKPTRGGVVQIGWK